MHLQKHPVCPVQCLSLSCFLSFLSICQSQSIPSLQSLILHPANQSNHHASRSIAETRQPPSKIALDEMDSMLPLQAAPSSSMHKALLLPLQMDSPTPLGAVAVSIWLHLCFLLECFETARRSASPLLHFSCLALEQDAWLRCWEEAAFGNIIHRTNQREAPWPMGASHSVWFLMVCSSGLSGWKQNETKQPSSIVLIRQHALVSRWFLLACLA